MTTIDPPYDWGRLQRVKGMARSVSQVKEYLESLGGCRYRYFLNRVVRAWDRPAAWLPMGTAVHAAAEWWEKAERKPSLEQLKAVYTSEYDRAVDLMLKETPNPLFWFSSGPYHGPEDIDRRRAVGLVQIERYWDYYVNQQPGEVIWITPSGEPAIELGFEFEINGVRMRGYKDQIVMVKQPRPKSKSKKALAEWEESPRVPRIRDIKTGKSPGDTFQLKVYDEDELINNGKALEQGDYWMGPTGKPTKVYDLTTMSSEQVGVIVKEMDDGVRAEDFRPNPSPERCNRCGVQTACRYAM